MTTVLTKSRLSVKAQILAAAAALAAAVVLPQICHVAGALTGVGTGLGELLLPMHLPIILVGLLAGPYAGAAAGVMAPLVSFALTGMPKIGLLPFLMIELCVYGLCSGLLCGKKLPTLVKVLAAQVAGRAVRAVAILVAFYGFQSAAVPVSIIWTSITAGAVGIVLQIILIPLIMGRVEAMEK